MRRRMAAAFVLGFAAGMAVLALGIMVEGAGPRVASSPAVVLAAPSPFPMVDAATPAAPPTTGEADRIPPGQISREQIPQEQISPEPHLAMPLAAVDPGKLASTFSQARDGHTHEALDIMAPRGTPVFAVAGGKVVKLFLSKPGGLTVYQFDDSEKWCYYYAHLDRYESGLKEGVLLRQGDVLGYVGSTGDASPEAPHLHFAVFRLGPEKQWWKGTAVDPLPLLK